MYLQILTFLIKSFMQTIKKIILQTAFQKLKKEVLI